jgi:hypothetical protein
MFSSCRHTDIPPEYQRIHQRERKKEGELVQADKK